MFTVTDEAHLFALFRVLLEAKFHENPSDTDIAVSRLVADLAVQVRDCLRQVEVGREGDAAQRKWEQWLTISPKRTEWRLAKAYAVRMWRDVWPRWKDEDRQRVIATLFSPFILTPEMATRFAAELDGAW